MAVYKRFKTVFGRAVRRFAGDNKRQRPDLVEIAPTRDDFLRRWAAGSNGVLDPDDEILTEIAPRRMDGKGSDCFQLHRRMRKTDLKYKALIGARKRAVLSKEWRIAPNANDPDESRAREVAEFVQAALQRIPDFRADMSQLLDAIPVGFAVSEIIWEETDLQYGGANGKTQTAWVPAQLKNRRQGRFGFDVEGRLCYLKDSNTTQVVRPEQFVVVTHEPENENRNGTSEGAEVWWWWYFKHQSVKWWMVFQEKFGLPTAVAKYPPGTKDEDIKKILEAVTAIQTEYGIALPDNVVIELLEAKRAGALNNYQDFVDMCDRCMAEALLGQSLATGQGDASGSYAQSKVHNEVRQEVTEADAIELMGALNLQLVKPIMLFNFGAEVPCPSLVINYESRDLAADLEMDIKLLDAGVPLPLRYFYETYKRPVPVDGEDIVERPAEATVDPWGEEGFSARGGRNGRNGRNGRDGRHGQAGTKGTEGTGGTEGTVGTKGRVAFALVGESDRKRRAREQTAFVGRCVKLAAPIYGRVAEVILAEAENADGLLDVYAATQRMELQHPVRDELTDVWSAAKFGSYCLAAAQVQRYADEQTEAAKEAGAGRLVRFAKEKVLIDYEPLDPEEAIEWFRGLLPMTEGDLESTSKEARAAAFTVADIEEREVLRRIQDMLSQSMREGKTLGEWKEAFPAFLEAEGLDPMRPHHVEAIYRTETMRAYGAGRTTALRDPEVAPAFPMWRYVAIKDDRTRPEHIALDGFVASSDDPFWLSHNPPWDYNCRCDIVPVTQKQIEEHGIEPTATVKMPDGTEADPRTWRGNSDFRGLGFGHCGLRIADCGSDFPRRER